MAIAHSMSMHHGRKKSVVARRYLLAALVIWIVCYPVRIAAVQSYGAAGEDRVAYHAPFDTEVQTFDYDTSVLSERADHVCLANAEGDMLRVDNLCGSISDDADVFAYITDAMEK